MPEPVRILCVDDEANVLSSIRRLFLDDDYEILSATSGDEGLAVLQKVSPVQLVISDYRMPRMNGVDFLKEVCGRWPDTVRIILSGYADTAAIVSAINEGRIYKFIPKPWNDDELKVAVANAVERYFLHKQNEELAGQLKRSNDKLRALNNSFQRLVEEKVSDLIVQNNMLSCSQNILDSLPVAVIGLNSDGLIVLCNKKGSELFLGDKGIILGMDRRDALPLSINNFVSEVAVKKIFSDIIRVETGTARIKGTFMTFPDEQEGIVLVLDQDN